MSAPATAGTRNGRTAALTAADEAGAGDRLGTGDTGGAADPGSRSLRVLAVLEAVAAGDWALSVADLTERLGLPKATAHRLCGDLEREGYLQRDLGGRRLVPGPRMGRLSYAVLAGAGGSERGLRRAVLSRLSAAVGETCNIAVPDGDAMIYVDRVETAWPLRIQLPIGSRVPLHATASGKLYLANLPPARRRRLLAVLDLDSLAANTLTNPDRLGLALDRIAETGIGTDDQELLDGMVAVAVAVRGAGGRLLATLAMHGPVGRLSLDQALRQVPALRCAAAELEALLFDDG